MSMSVPARALSRTRTCFMEAAVPERQRVRRRFVSRDPNARPRRLTRRSVEHPLALLVHDLARLGERELHRVVVGGMAVGADEFVLLGDAADLLGDGAGGLVLPLRLVGRGA